MTDHAGMTGQEGTQHDGQTTGIELPPEVLPPLPLDPPLPPPEETPSENPPPPILNEIDMVTAIPIPPDVMTTSSSSPKRPWSAMETHGSSSDDSHEIPTKKCKIHDITAPTEHCHVEKVNEKILKKMELKNVELIQKLSKVNKINAKLDALIHQMDTQDTVVKETITLMKNEPVASVEEPNLK